jgi:hypothetical protein
MDQNNETFKLNPSEANIVELLYGQPKTGTNSYGNWYLYGVKKDGIETGFFATEALHGKLSAYGQGAKVSINKEEYAPGKSAWTVQPLEGAQPQALSTALSSATIDNRTHDIHKQVCLKLAVELFGNKVGMITDTDMVTIDANMQSLLSILESEEKVKSLTNNTLAGNVTGNNSVGGSSNVVKDDEMPF